MYSAKVYSHTGEFKYSIGGKDMSSQYHYNATINSTYGGWSFDYWGEGDIHHKDRIQLYKYDKPVYIGYVTSITYYNDGINDRRSIGCSGIIGLLQYIPYTATSASGDPWQLIRDCFNHIDWVSIEQVQTFWKNITIKIENNINYLQILQEVLKYTENWYLFIDENLKVYFWPYQVHHTLTYKRDCVGIEWGEDSTSYYNKITLNYNEGSFTQEESDWIQQYWVHHRVIKDERIQLLTTAQQRVATELARASIKKNCKITVNNDYPFDTIKPWHILSIRNTSHPIIHKKITKIQYGSHIATITLNHHQSLEHFISQQNNV